MYMSVKILYQTVQILVTFFFFTTVYQFFIHFSYKAPYFSCQAIIQYTICNLFSNTFETARYNMNIYVVFFFCFFFCRTVALQKEGMDKVDFPPFFTDKQI